MEWFDLAPIAGPTAAFVGAVWAALKSRRFQDVLRRVMALDDLDSRVTAAVEVAVAALRAALEARGEELTRLEAELEDLRGQIAELRTSDVAKDRRIKELEREVEQLRSENAALRAQLDARSGN